MKETVKKLAALLAAVVMTASLSGCVTANKKKTETSSGGLGVEEIPEETGGRTPEIEIPEENNTESGNAAGGEPEIQTPTPEKPTPEKPEQPEPKVKTVTYITATADGVNLRSGAGTSYAVKGTAEKSTLYALNGTDGSWYKTGYKNGTVYISKSYAKTVEMTSSNDERIEAVIAEGTKLLGTKYVYGAVRYHDGSGKLLKNFTTSEFDCSSLMQYIFYKGANVNLQVNTRTQVYQGKTVTRSQLKRGDLMFFTNASRKNNTGVERIGHVALYLGDNWILHTASDYAKIEQISSTRWGYFIQGQRII